MRRVSLAILCLATILLPLALNNVSFPFLPPEEALSQFSPSMPNVSAIGNQPPRPVGGFIYPLPRTPKLSENSTHYIYDTLYGNYCFLKALPFVASYSDHIDREVMVKASAFFLLSKYVLLPGAFTVEKDSSLFSVNVTVMKLTKIIAYLRIDWIFYADKEPKIVVVLSKTAQWQSESIGDFQIFWVLVSPHKYAKAKGYATKTVSSTTLESYGNHTGIAMADDSLVFLAKKYLKIDWSDFGAAEDVKVGAFDLSSLSKKLSGSGVYVLFPKNIAQIDPYTVATSTTAGALVWGGMTKSHWDGTSYYWQAYCDGTNWVAEYSSDGQTWTNTPVTLFASWTRPVAFAFAGTEIFTVRGTYASQYHSQTLGGTPPLYWSISCVAYLYFKRGVISGAAINWDSEVQVASYTQSYDCDRDSDYWTRGGVYAEFRYYDITEGTDGLLTIVASANKYYYIEEAPNDPRTGLPIPPWYVYAQGSTYHYIAYKSTTATGSSWAAGTTIETSTSTTSTTYWGTDTRPRLAPLASAVILCAENKDGALTYRKSSAWTTGTSIDASIKDVNAWGSLTGKNVTTGRCGLAYVDFDDTIDVWWYDGSTTHSDLNVIAAVASSPSFTLNNVTNGVWILSAIRGSSIVYRKYSGSTDTWDASPMGGHGPTAYGDAQIDTAQSKFGGASGLFDGTGDYLSVPDSDDWYFGTGDFTIDFWVRFNALPSVSYRSSIYSQWQDANNLFLADLLNNAGTYQWTMKLVSGGSSLFEFQYNAVSLATNTWYHGAYVRSGTTFYVFQNGNLITTGTSAASIPDFSATVQIGRLYTYDVHALNGWLDEFRISKGVARWTSNFTPPTSAYTTNSYTCLLLHMDGSDASTIFTDSSTGIIAVGLTSPVGLSSSRTVLNGKVLLCWQTGASSPYTVNFDMLSIGFSTINFSGFTVSASDGTYQSKWNITAKWPDDSPVSGGSFYVYNATAQRASATSDSNGLIQFTVGGTIGGSGSLTINGTKDGAIGSTSVSFSTTATGGAYTSCPSTWYAGEPRSVSVSFTNAAQIDSTKIKLENVRICFRLMSGSTVLFQANSSTLFNVDANSLKTYSQSLTLTGVASTGNYVLRALVLQIGSEWTIATIDQTIYVQALGETGSYSRPPNLILPSLSPLALTQGESRSFTFTVQLSQVSVADFMASTPSGAPSNWISVMAPSRISIASPAELTVMVSVPSDALPGSYTILIPISASASSGSTRQMAQFTLTVEAAKPSSPTAPSMSLVNIFSDIPPLFIFMVIGAVAVTAAVLVATNEKKPKGHKYYHR